MIKVRLAVMNDDACWEKPAFDYRDQIRNAEFYAVYVDLELPMSCNSDEKMISRMFDELSTNDLENFIISCDNHIRLEVDKEERERARDAENRDDNTEYHLSELHSDMYNEFGTTLLYSDEDFFYKRVDNVETELMRP